MSVQRNRYTAVMIVIAIASPAAVAAGKPGGDDPPRIIANSQHVIVSLNDQPGRRRRTKPKRRSGKYEVISVAGGGRIEGVVLFKGTVPEPETIQVVKDHDTCDARAKSRPKINTDPQGHVAQAVVFLGNIKAGKSIPETLAKPVINQKNCTFDPHVQVLQTRTPFEVVNLDPVAHNAQCVQNMVTLFNPMQPKQGLRNEFKIKRPGLATVTCAVHNWMRAFVYVLPHPYHCVTAEDGAFVISDVPPGDYELVVWQEHLGERTRQVHVDADKTTTLEFELTKE